MNSLFTSKFKMFRRTPGAGRLYDLRSLSIKNVIKIIQRTSILDSKPINNLMSAPIPSRAIGRERERGPER